MSKAAQQIVLTTEDHETIIGYLRLALARNTFSKQEAEELEAELKKAKLVTKNLLPEDVVALNSTVKIKDEKDGKIMDLTVVTPEKADIKQRRISIMSPIGTALIGFKKGSLINWMVPAGKKTFRILEVSRPLE